jgi:hypothetical protein
MTAADSFSAWTGSKGIRVSAAVLVKFYDRSGQVSMIKCWRVAA